ncbi:DUF413 domain-containing protein [Motiliproteus sp.]|uniref:DUF413 domain-containing protein n=1 Tax=Motiliproteus sp. TaxID=1898955 RepID=UPI003BAD51A0
MYQQTAFATSFASSRKFHDNENFPHGLDRCGEFTCKQSDLLTQRGHAYLALSTGERKPKTSAENQFVTFSQGRKKPETEDERVWDRYCRLVNQAKNYYSVGLNLVPELSTNDFLIGTD